MFTVDKVREKYLEFFKEKGCKIVKSSSLVPNDPTLLFTNAGMVQFKNYYKGIEKPNFTRATSTQKCVRAGGKHNDLDNVGYTARHHTFFEMLGNFSFGDYFKEDAIVWAWEFLTKVLLIPSDRLLVTVYYNDDEAYNIWKNKVGLTEDRIIKISTKDNFWEMGDTGPCGSCSEIFYDHGSTVSGGIPGSQDENGDRYIEIWNIVFTQFNRKENGELEDLQSKNIDTGMGLERMTAILQGVHNNYEIDLFKKLIYNSINIIGDGNIFSHRIIADHLRSSSFLVCDGVLPSNEGRGYVLRRIMRRAMLQIYKLGCKKTSMYRLAPCLVDLMGNFYPELSENENLVMEIIKEEEDKFRSTLEKGIRILDEKISKTNNRILSGYDAFELYDTYGFPLDMTDILLKEKNMMVNYDDFENEMSKQKKRARANWVGSGDMATENNIYLELSEKTDFVGYERTVNSAKILKLLKDDKFVTQVGKGDKIEIVTDSTCFYGEMGGQVGDSGIMIFINPDGSIPLPFSIVEIYDTKRSKNGIIIHKGTVEIGNFKVGDMVNMSIDKIKRLKISANHSATHLLHFALRSILGETLVQKGSYVNQNSLRFDVSYSKPINEINLRKIEEIVNGIIIQNNEVKTDIMNLKEAKKFGAIALFNEKYEENVRVVSMGLDINKNEYKKTYEKKDNYDFNDVLKELNFHNYEEKYCSRELCGGTHVKNTGDIGFFKIIKEESIASGVRRIEAYTGLKALEFVNDKITILDNLSNNFKVSHKEISDKVSSIFLENRELKKQIDNFKKDRLNNIIFDETQLSSGVILFSKILENVEPQDLKQIIIHKKNTIYKNNSIICAICNSSNKSVAIIAISNDLVEKYNAVNILKLLNCHGGGVATFAMGSCDKNIDLSKINNI